MKILPKEFSRFDIRLCRMVYMPLVRPTLTNDIKRLEAEFTHGYWPSVPVFYVSIYNEHGDERSVKDEDTTKWTSINDDFKAKLALNPHLQFLSSRMFFICDGNHCWKAWTGYISRLHGNDWKWHYSVYSICLDVGGKGGFS
jgi:hypothetical protein